MFTLLVMAAGVGRRFGGDKQLAAVGPNGEAFLDYAIAEAVAAGASKVVLVVRTEIESAVRGHVEARHGASQRNGIEFAYVRQDEHGPPRTKPWGTAHAVLVAADEVPGPFVVCNADDYYGPTALSALAAAAGELAVGEACLCIHRLGRTLSRRGAVSRGVCEVSGGRLVGIVEHHGVARRADGAIASAVPAAELADDDSVSLNLWAFPRAAFGWIGDGFDRFLADRRADADAECLLPTVVAERMARGLLSVRVVPTDESWIGVTNPEDLPVARAALARERASGSETRTG